LGVGGGAVVGVAVEGCVQLRANGEHREQQQQRRRAQRQEAAERMDR